MRYQIKDGVCKTEYFEVVYDDYNELWIDLKKWIDNGWEAKISRMEYVSDEDRTFTEDYRVIYTKDTEEEAEA